MDSKKIKLARMDNENLRLAIILSMPRPVDIPEVGLLVWIYDNRDTITSKKGEEVVRDEVDQPIQSTSKKGKAVDRGDQPTVGSHDRGTDTKQILYCRIIRRLAVSRLALYSDAGTTSENNTATGSQNGGSVLDHFSFFDGEIIGECVDDDQQWCVDGYPTNQETEPGQDDEDDQTTGSLQGSDETRKLKRIIASESLPL